MKTDAERLRSFPKYETALARPSAIRKRVRLSRTANGVYDAYENGNTTLSIVSKMGSAAIFNLFRDLVKSEERGVKSALLLPREKCSTGE